MGKDIITSVFPRAGGIEDICQLVNQRRFPAGFTAQNRNCAHKERLHFGRDVIPVAERVFADLRPADVHECTLRIDQHRFNAQMLAELRCVGLFRGVDPVGRNALLFHKRFNAVAPHVPAVWIRLHALFVKRMNANVFLIFEGLKQPAQAIRHRRLLRHGAVFKQLTVTGFIVTHDDVQLVDLATGALDQVDMAGMQRVKLTKHHADVLLHTREFKPQKAM